LPALDYGAFLASACNCADAVAAMLQSQRLAKDDGEGLRPETRATNQARAQTLNATKKLDHAITTITIISFSS